MAPRRRVAPILTTAAVAVVAGALLLIPRPEGPSLPVADSERGGRPVTLEDGILTTGAAVAPPFVSPAAGGVSGFDVNLITEIARRLGLRLRLVRDDASDPYAGLVAGRLDVVVAAARITPNLEERVNLSEPYFSVRQAVLVNIAARPELTGLAGLTEGGRVGVVEGSTAHAWAVAHLALTAIEVQPYPDADQVVLALATGAVDAVITDELSAEAETASRESFQVVETIATGEGIGIAVDPGNPALLGAVNGALAELVADGTYDRLYDRHAGSLPAGGRITSPGGAR
jgi:ABC-type amino acid transport substrate-binding protein